MHNSWETFLSPTDDPNPIPSMYGILTIHLGWFFGFHVGKYTIQGCYAFDDSYILHWHYSSFFHILSGEFSQNAREIQVFEVLELQYPKGQEN